MQKTVTASFKLMGKDSMDLLKRLDPLMHYIPTKLTFAEEFWWSVTFHEPFHPHMHRFTEFVTFDINAMKGSLTMSIL